MLNVKQMAIHRSKENEIWNYKVYNKMIYATVTLLFNYKRY